jgi:outer membrane biogenesis lipoprotein LolB
MKRLLLCLAIATLFACNNSGGLRKAEDAQDAGREFIRASLDGDYEKAKFYMLKDEDNLMILDGWKKGYARYSKDEVKKFKDADIRPANIQALNDSITIYTYSNTYTKDTTTLKIVRINKEWLVDLKQTFISE